jgi:glyoxylase-like metal-dependent hydrolase (beta-lactamase superfamily II)
MRRTTTLALLAAAALFLGAAVAPPALREIATEIYFLRGADVRGPDGNSLVFLAPSGLIVFDTGRHPEHAQRLINFARLRHRPVAAIVNSHWHLDHVGGNLALREAYPRLRVYGSDAIRGALKGFLADYRRQLVDALAQSSGNPDAEATYQADLDLIDAGARLAPDEVITSAGKRLIAGRALSIGVESRAVTASDVWVLDPQSGVLAAGDLVTVPVPFFDTACPRGWQVALDDLAKQKFAILVPGHGAPMSPDDFDAYRRAFGALVDCAASSKGAGDCADAWFRDGGAQIAAADSESSRAMMRYYLENVLRGDPATLVRNCATAAVGDATPDR